MSGVSAVESSLATVAAGLSLPTRSFLFRAARARWLDVDDALEALHDEARAWVAARFEEHRAALGLAPSGAVPGVALRFARDAVDALEQLRAAWRPLREGAAPGLLEATARYTDALEAHGTLWWPGAPLPSGASLGAVLRVGEAVDVATREAFAGSARWHAIAAQGHRALPGADAVIMQQALHLEAHGPEGQPSPWKPLFELWERGAWPLALPGGGLLVYVPERRGGGVVLRRANEELGLPFYDVPTFDDAGALCEAEPPGAGARCDAASAAAAAAAASAEAEDARMLARAGDVLEAAGLHDPPCRSARLCPASLTLRIDERCAFTFALRWPRIDVGSAPERATTQRPVAGNAPLDARALALSEELDPLPPRVLRIGCAQGCHLVVPLFPMEGLEQPFVLESGTELVLGRFSLAYYRLDA